MPNACLNVRERALRHSVHFNDVRPKEDIIACMEEIEAVLKKHKMYLIHYASHVHVKERETGKQRAQFFCI